MLILCDSFMTDNLPDNLLSPKVYFDNGFDSLCHQAIEQSVEHGAAKINGFLGKTSLERLQERCPSDAELLAAKIPEIAQFITYLCHDAKNTWSVSAEIAYVQNTSAYNQTIVSHLDPPAYGKDGLSLVLPLTGAKALFGADDERFGDLNGVCTKRQSSYVTEYGPGDAILLRQNVASVNAQPKLKLQSWHYGFVVAKPGMMPTEWNRKILLIDLANPDVRYAG